jgi:hypothetical protein
MKNYTDEVPVPWNVNRGLQAATGGMMTVLLGRPRRSYTQECQPITNPALRKRIITDSVGPFRVTGFDLAVRDLRNIVTEITKKYPKMKLSSAGMLCCRLVRGSKTSISNHSWGTAFDIKIDGVLDDYGDGKVQYGLTLIAPIFNKHGWYWGAHFRKEDGMHFDVSVQRLKQWQSQGLLNGLT